MQAAIIGAGVIGRGWAARFLLHGWDVCVYDADPNAPTMLAATLDQARRVVPGLYRSTLPSEGKLDFSPTAAAAVIDADWIQESVPESLDIKKSLYSEVSDKLQDAAVLASSTSGFKPTQLAEEVSCAEQLLVCHPFNPVYLLPAVELVGGAQTSATTLSRADELLSGIGMKPVRVRKEIDAHIADRLLEALWREALWLIAEDVASTEEIDEIMRHGFGLRWAQMGLFETYRIAGGEAGMAHFLAQFGPALEWPWSRLTDVPELNDALISRISRQSDAQSGHLSISELEAQRDDNLVAIMRALKDTNSGVGAHLNAFDRLLNPNSA